MGFYVFSPLLELAALVVLALICRRFLGHKHDKIPKGDTLPK